MKLRFNDKAFEVWEHEMIKSNLNYGLRPNVCYFFKKLKEEKAFIFIISTHIFLMQIKKE